MTRVSIALLLTISILPLACSDAEPAGDDDANSSDSGGSAETGQDDGATTSSPPGSTDGTSVGTSVGTSDGMTASGDSGEADSSDDATTDPETGGESGDTTGGASAGYCAMGCEEAIDCCPVGSLSCPSQTYPDNWSCEDNVCVFGGCANDDDCESAVTPGQSCHEVEGTGVCFDPCAEDNDCPDSTTCSGTADDEMMFCQAVVEPCEDDSSCNGAGICDTETGECYCDGDANCTAEGADVCVAE